jgi:type IV secretion system protein VirB10
MIAGIGAFLFVSYNLLDTSAPTGRGAASTDSNQAEPSISPAVGQYSDAYFSYLRAFEDPGRKPQTVAELPTNLTRRPAGQNAASPQTPQQRQAPQQGRSRQEQTEDFLASVPRNVKVVRKEPSKEYAQSRALLASALTANSEVKLDSSSGIQLPGMDEAQPLLAAVPGVGSSAVSDAISSFAPRGTEDFNASAMAHQDRSDSFIQRNQSRTGQAGQIDRSADSEYLSSSRREPRGKYELMAGSLISGVLMGSVNSDTPGTVLGQISENVYDTPTGAYLLIPQGSRMVGVYDSHVVYGQNRLVVVWQRILYPDGTSLNLEGMIGGDQAGSAGFKQYVDNHYSRLIGAALLASVFTAAGKMATNDDRDNQGNESKAAEAVMETMSQLGARMAERNMNVAPTLRIRPGYRFSIVTMKDIAFAEPYRE